MSEFELEKMLKDADKRIAELERENRLLRNMSAHITRFSEEIRTAITHAEHIADRLEENSDEK